MDLGMDMSNINEVMTCYFINTKDDFAGEETFINDLQTMRDMIGTKCVVFMKRYIGGHVFRVICSANSSSDGKPSGVAEDGEVVIRGNMVILGDRVTFNGRPGMRTLTDEEKAILGNNLGLMTIEMERGDRYNVYCMCNMSKTSKKEEGQ